MAYTQEELDWLRGSVAGTDAAAAVADAAARALTKKSMVDDVTALRQAYGGFARAAIELVESRRLSATKMDPHVADNWWTDKDAAQQATPQAVADYRANYLAELGITSAADVTCSVGTELQALHARGIRASGSDLDPLRVAMARINCPEVPITVADALMPVETDAQVIVADPARRNSSGRIHRFEDMQPSVPDLIAAYPGKELMIKCAPGVDFADLEDWAGQVDVISVNGAVKEACAYTPGLRITTLDSKPVEPGSFVRRAIVITDDAGEVRVQELASKEKERNGEAEDSRDGQHGKYIMEPDGAIIRAGLVRDYAWQENLWLLDPHLAYVTGDRIPDGVRGFEVESTVPLKQLKKELSTRKIGRAEILVRGTDVDPDQLRKKLKLKGKYAATIVIARHGGAATRGGRQKAALNGVYAYICTPVIS